MFFQPKSKKLLSINDLKRINFDDSKLVDRKKYKILVLDDSGFPQLSTLQKIGYKDIEVQEEYINIEQFSSYDIIFCDINGVANDLDPVYQGAALAKQIKEVYPEKIVIIFSAVAQHLDFNEYYQSVDGTIKKNMNGNEFSKEIDKWIIKLNNPINKWIKFKIELENSGIPTGDTAVFEDYYVKSIITNKDYKKEIKKYCNKSKLSEQLNKYLPVLFKLTVEVIEIVTT